jgi:hypothetical protein
MKISFRIPMHFPVHFLLGLLFIAVATAAPTGSDSNSNEDNTIPSPPTLSTAGGGKSLQGLERGMAAGKMLYLAKSGGPVATDPNSASSSEGEEDMKQPASPVSHPSNDWSRYW